MENKPTKNSEGKLPYEFDWEFIRGMAERMNLNKQNGQYEKYGWRDKGVNISEMLDAETRHLIDMHLGNFDDNGQKYGHLFAIACNAMLIYNTLKNKNELPF